MSCTGNFEVVHHLGDDQALLGVLAPEDGDVRLHQVEELGDHGEHAGEVAGPADAAEVRGARAGLHRDADLAAVHGLDRRA